MISSQIEELPSGNLLVVKNGNHFKWLVTDGHKPIYLSKKNRELAEKLAYKKYLMLQLEHIEQELYAIEQYLTHHNSNSAQIEMEFLNSKKFKDLISIKTSTITEQINNWIEESYIKCNMNPENLIHKTYSGNMVRSKSEALIDMFLFKNDIPFRYECKLELGNKIFYPDFTIMNPKTGEIKYWEHFGMMDDENYEKHTMSKIGHYISYGIMPGDQLIMTFESKKFPLNAELIEKIIKVNFL